MRVGAAAVGRLHICCIYQRFTLAIVLPLVPCRLVQPLLWFVQDAAPFDQVQYQYVAARYACPLPFRSFCRQEFVAGVG